MAWQNEDALTELYGRKRRALIDGSDVIDLSMVNPDLPPPRILQDRLIESINKPGSHRYSSSSGVKKLREAFASRYQQVFDVAVDPESEVCVTLGAKDAVLHALAMFKERSEVVLVGEPMYPAYRYAIEYLGMRIVPLKLDQENFLREVGRLLKVYPKATLLLNFPSNPSGQTVEYDFYGDLAQLVEHTEVGLINDFVYGEMLYSGKVACSMLKHPKLRARSVETYSLSKAFSVPGWRVGALVGAPEIVSGVSRLKSRVDFGAFLPLQFAAAAALQTVDTEVRELTNTYARRHSLLLRLLERGGWSVMPAQGGCCVWARMPESIVSRFEIVSSADFAHVLLDQGLAALPGEVFGGQLSNYMRFALVVDDSRLRMAADRLAVAVGKFLESKNNAA